MSQLKELLIEEMQDLLHAENQLLGALPNMAKAAKSPKLREAFEKHLEQTRTHVERLKEAFQLLGSEAEPTPCRAMAGLIEEGKERIEETEDKEDVAADLSLITAAQKVEHYEIAGYGNLQNLALQIDERDAARLFARTLGEEEATDHLLTEITKPLLQQIRMEELEGAVSERKASRAGGKTRHA